MSLISSNLKYLRRINGLTQDQFARRIGTKRANVGAYEESRAVPPVDTLKIIANTFGITVDDFVKKDIRKLRETPDLTFEFEPKSFTSSPQTIPVDPFDTPINQLKNDPFFDERSNYQNRSAVSENTEITPSIGDLLNRFLENETPTQKPTEQISQRLTLKPNFSRETSPPSLKTSHQNTPLQQPNQVVNQNIQFIKKALFNEYLYRATDINFLNSLPTFTIPTLPNGEYRAFESGEDFSFEGAILIGSLVKNWHEISDGKNYVLVSKTQGIIYRRVYNQVKIKGTLLLSTDNNRFASSEISFTDVIETWEIKAFVSHVLPEPITPFNKLGTLVDEMKFELERIKK